MGWGVSLVALMLISSFASSADSVLEGTDPDLWIAVRDYSDEAPYRVFVGTTVETAAYITTCAWVVVGGVTMLIMRKGRDPQEARHRDDLASELESLNNSTTPHSR